MDWMVIASLLAGLVLLTLGGESLVRGSSRLAQSFGLSPLVIGLTVVAFGTSSPEMAASVAAGLDGRSDIAIGNVIGSNIFNVLFILGLSAMVAPLAVSEKLIRIDVPFMIAVSVILAFMALDGRLGRIDGSILLAGLVAYTLFSYRTAKVQNGSAKAQSEKKDSEPRGSRLLARSTWIELGLIALGLVLLVVGARFLIDGAIEIARLLGVSELIIGLTVVAAGTSLPEVATSVLAAIRGEREIAVGNIVGSNIFNIFGVLGLTSLVSIEPIAISPKIMRFDIPIMIAVAAACLPVFFTGNRVTRGEGIMFFAFYVAFTIYLTLDGMDHPALSSFNLLMMSLVLPLTAAAIAFRAWREMRSRVARRARG